MSFQGSSRGNNVSNLLFMSLHLDLVNTCRKFERFLNCIKRDIHVKEIFLKNQNFILTSSQRSDNYLPYVFRYVNK